MEMVNSDPKFRELGSADIDVFLQSGKHKRQVCFRDFGVDHVEDCTNKDLVDADLVIAMPTVSWNSYLHKRRIGVGPSLHSFNIEKLLSMRRTRCRGDILIECIVLFKRSSTTALAR